MWSDYECVNVLLEKKLPVECYGKCNNNDWEELGEKITSNWSLVRCYVWNDLCSSFIAIEAHPIVS